MAGTRQRKFQVDSLTAELAFPIQPIRVPRALIEFPLPRCKVIKLNFTSSRLGDRRSFFAE